MNCILPLPAINKKNMDMILDVYKNCKRSIVFHREKFGAKTTNYFIDNSIDFENIINEIIIPVGINRSEIFNLWNSVDPDYNCSGINFNVLTPNDYLKPHVDYNPTKLNILLSGSENNCVHFENEKWCWETPAIIDVSKIHYVSDLSKNMRPRVSLQIFLTKDFEYYQRTINRKPNW